MKEKYPATLVPVPGWNKFLDINEMSEDFPIIRRIAGRFENDKNKFIDIGLGVYHLSLDAELQDFDTKKMANLSMNIVSDECSMTDSEYKHNTLKINGKKIEIWNGKRGNRQINENVCCRIVPCYFLVFKSTNIHNQPFEYERTYPSKEQLDGDVSSIKKELVQQIFKSNTTMYNVSGKLKLKHAPTFLNYWHIILEIYAPSHKPPLQKTDKGWRNDAANALFESILRKNIWINKLPCCPMPKNIYEDSQFCKIRLFGEKLIRNLRVKSIKIKIVER